MRPGSLPTSLRVNGRDYAIDTDFRNVLQILIALADDKLKDREKAYICMRRLYEHMEDIPRDDAQAAYDAAADFITAGMTGDSRAPNVVNWSKDEPLIFPEINKVAGCEVRALPYLHWWTFLGYFQAVDRDGIWGTVLTIRQKRAKGKKLEKYEKEFYKSNKALISMKKEKLKSGKDLLESIFKELSEEEEEDD